MLPDIFDTKKEYFSPLRALFFALIISRAAQVLSEVFDTENITRTTEGGALSTHHLLCQTFYLVSPTQKESPAPARERKVARGFTIAASSAPPPTLPKPFSCPGTDATWHYPEPRPVKSFTGAYTINPKEAQQETHTMKRSGRFPPANRPNGIYLP